MINCRAKMGHWASFGVQILPAEICAVLGRIGRLIEFDY